MASTLTSKVLVADGSYKPLHNVLVGDKLMGMHGRPVTVRKVNVEKNENRKLMINVRHDTWYTSVPLTSTSEVLVWNRESRRPHWIQSEFYTEAAEQILLMPLGMRWDLPDTFEIQFANETIHPSYHLGFLFGTYMKIGNIIDDTVSFHCDTSSIDMINTIRRYMPEVFGKENIKEHRTTSTYYHDVFYTSLHRSDTNKNTQKTLEFDDIKEIFLRFRKSDKRFPREFLCRDFEYIKGIHFGMMLTGTNGHHNFASTAVKELTYWTSYVLGRPSIYGQMKFHHEGVDVLATRSSLFGLERKKVDLISLEVDCTSDAYIIGNMIVRPQ